MSGLRKDDAIQIDDDIQIDDVQIDSGEYIEFDSDADLLDSVHEFTRNMNVEEIDQIHEIGSQLFAYHEDENVDSDNNESVFESDDQPVANVELHDNGEWFICDDMLYENVGDGFVDVDDGLHRLDPLVVDGRVSVQNQEIANPHEDVNVDLGFLTNDESAFNNFHNPINFDDLPNIVNYGYSITIDDDDNNHAGQTSFIATVKWTVKK